MYSGCQAGRSSPPLLFAIAADLLQCAINKEYEIGNLHPPFPQRSENPFPIIQYADDTIIIMQGCDSQLAILKDILNKISVSSGPIVNSEYKFAKLEKILYFTSSYN
jgi:hypothetical protein